MGDLVAATGIKRERLTEHLEELDRAGRIRRDRAGRVVGSAGLSVSKDRHVIELDGRRFWTWCAYDIFGVFGALEASGTALSPSPEGRTMDLRFERGRPVNGDAVLFRPDDNVMGGCEDGYEERGPHRRLCSDADDTRKR